MTYIAMGHKVSKEELVENIVLNKAMGIRKLNRLCGVPSRNIFRDKAGLHIECTKNGEVVLLQTMFQYAEGYQSHIVPWKHVLVRCKVGKKIYYEVRFDMEITGACILQDDGKLVIKFVKIVF